MRSGLVIIFLASGFLSGCGGGSIGASPSVFLSASSLTFGNEVVDTASQPLTVTLTNSGTATLAVGSIAASTNFAQTNNCGAPLASGANCTITVTFTPNASGSLSGTLSCTDNAAGSPQTVSLGGTGVSSGGGGGGSCSVQGQECGAAELPPCCAGLVCAAASDREFCQPATPNAKSLRSNEDQGMADRIR